MNTRTTRRLLWIASLALAVTALSPLAATADDNGWHTPTASVPSKATPEEIAVEYVRTTDALRMRDLDLEVDRVLPVAGEMKTVRLRQTHGGLPVLGSAVAVVVDPAGRVRFVRHDVARDLTVDVTPAISLERAWEIVAEAGFAMHDQALGELLVRATPDGGQLVWQVGVPTTDGGWKYQVDAHTGALTSVDRGAFDALGRVYPISQPVTPDTMDLELPELDTVAPDQVLRGWNGLFDVTNFVNANSQGAITAVEQTVVPNSGEDFLYDPPAQASSTNDEFAQVSTFYHLSRMRQWFASEQGLDMTGSDWKLTAVANMRQADQNGGLHPFDNAYYSPMGIGGSHPSPNLIAIGQGTVDFAYDSDVIMHEFVHYISGVAVGYNQGQLYADEWGLSPTGGSIDEGVADYFAATVNGDPVISELALGALGASRDLANTAKVCPDDVWGEVHADGEIIGAYTWALRETFGTELADSLVWSALTTLTPSATLQDLADGVDVFAENLLINDTITLDEYNQIVAVAANFGLDDCGKTLELTDETTRRFTMVGMDVLGLYFGLDCASLQGFGFKLQSPFHVNLTPPADAIGVKFVVDVNPTAAGSLQYDLYARANDHVTFNTGGFVPTVQDSDYRRLGRTSETSELVIDATSNPPFDPGASYHFVITQANCPTSFTTVHAEYIYDEPMGDVGPGDVTADMTSDTSTPGDTSTPEDTATGDDTSTGDDTTTAADTASTEDTSTPGEDTSPVADTSVPDEGVVAQDGSGNSDDCACQVRVDRHHDDSPSPLLPAAFALVAGLLVARRRRRRD